jgi:hypothetical protein
MHIVLWTTMKWSKGTIYCPGLTGFRGVLRELEMGREDQTK